MNHVISSEQFDKKSVENLFQLTDHMKKDRERYGNALNGSIIATLFYEPSTRTRLSFEAAVHRLGGKVIGTENALGASSVTKGESLEDTIQVVAGYADAIVLRHNENHAAERASFISSVPIINAGDGSGEHPTQSLLDAYTIYSSKKRLHHLSIAILGDLRFGRTIHSLVKILSLYESVTIYGLAVPGLELPTSYIEFLERRNTPYIACHQLEEIPSDVDIIYQTRTQKERLPNYKAGDGVIRLDQKRMQHFSDRTILLHPLPRNEEIAPDIDQDPRAFYFQQAHNGMYVRMALMHDLLFGERK